MTLGELSRASGLPKSTVHRLIARLIALGMVEQHRAGYRLGLGLLELAANTPPAGMRDLAMPYLAALHRWSGLTVQLAVLRDLDIVYLETLAAGGAPPLLARPGARLPANCSALGKALLAWEGLEELRALLPAPMPTMTSSSVSDVEELLAELRRIRTSGLAHDRHEAQLGTASVAAPILIHDLAVGAVSVAHPSDVEIGRDVEHALRDTASLIARASKDALAQGRAHWFPHEL
jgi:DNA-binding IclR family transcriptional regulator